MAPRTPNVHVRELTEDYVKFVLTDTDPSVANALRRVIMSHVPTIAIDLVDIEENSTVLCDEFIAHRLGLIPLLSHKAREMIFPYQEDPSGDAMAGVTLTLSASCTGDDPVLVTSDDLVSEDPAVLPVGHPLARGAGADGMGGGGERKEGIIIAKLRKGQSLRVTCTARKGIGKDHAKWSPVATAVFRYQPQVTLRQEVIRRMTPAQRADWAASDPNQILKYDAASQSVSLGDVEAYAYDRECVIRCAELGFPTAIEIVQKQDTFIFTVEATGALSPADVVLNAIDVLKEKLDLVLHDIDLNPEGAIPAY